MTEKLLKTAAAEIGVKESPAGSNNVKYNTEYYGKAVSGAAYSWCATFVAWCFGKAGLPALTPFYKEGEAFRYNALNAAYCPNWVSAAKRLGQWVTGGYLPGDAALFTTNGKDASHIGIIESVAAGGRSFVSIEGNAGDMVARRTHAVGSGVLGAFRPKYAPEAVNTAPNNAAGVKAALDKLTKAGVINSPDYWLGNYSRLPYLDELIIRTGALV